MTKPKGLNNSKTVNQLLTKLLYPVKLPQLFVWLLTVSFTCALLPVSAMPGNNIFSNLTEEECASGESFDIMQLASMKATDIIDSFYRKRVKNDHFNGAVLVAKNGVPLYEGAFGYGDFSTKDPMTVHSPVQLASVSKTFTGSAILLLAEQGFLSLDDSIQKFFPDFPYKDITVRLLLSHRTGLPDYTVFPKEYFTKSAEYITNQDVINYFTVMKPSLRCKPDHMFIYCNTNYAILASIVEQVTAMSYHQFMHDFIFAPLGMDDSYVFNPADSTTFRGTTSYTAKGAVWKNNIYDGVVGDKGIYSSVEDMLKWDNALRNGLLLSEESLQEAYKPRSLDKYSFAGEKERNYGYGWRMLKQPDKSYLIYHNGFWHGSNNVFARDLDDGYTVIVLGNKSNNNNYWTQPVWDVLNQLKTFTGIASAQ
ncbi:MAG: serine hydrolase domain-containing protein [Chitinophagales bacterium]